MGAHTETRTMQAIVQRAYGSPEVLTYGTVPRPAPKADEVLIAVRASSLNFADVAMVTGRPALIRAVMGLRRPRHRVLGPAQPGDGPDQGRPAGDHGDVGEVERRRAHGDQHLVGLRCRPRHGRVRQHLRRAIRALGDRLHSASLDVHRRLPCKELLTSRRYDEPDTVSRFLDMAGCPPCR